MDSLSDSSRCELDSVTSSDSLRIFADEFCLNSSRSPEPSSVELSKRLSALELENERLRIEAESARIDANARNASNHGLKSKIAELFVEAQISLQERQKLENRLKDANDRLSAAENSCKWYKTKLHDSQANEKARQMEIDTYQGILRQRQQSLADMTDRCEEFSSRYHDLIGGFRIEKRKLNSEIEALRAEKKNCENCRDRNDGAPVGSPDLMEFKLEAMEKSLLDCQAQIRSLGERLSESEISRNSAEAKISKYRWLMSSMEENAEKLRAEKSEVENSLKDAQSQSEELRKESEHLQIAMLTSKREKMQVEEAITHLRSQLDKMIAHHKFLKARNLEAERKLNAMQDLQNENKRLKSISYANNCSLLKKFKERKRRAKHLEIKFGQEKSRLCSHAETSTGEIHLQRDKTMLSMRDCLKRALERNEELKERLKGRTSDESIDEGYGDGSFVVSGTSDLPSSPELDSLLIESARDVLTRSKNFMNPLETSLEELRGRIQQFREHRFDHFPNQTTLQYLR